MQCAQDAEVLAAPDMLALALDAVIENAVHFTSEGGTITLTGEVTSTSCKVRVADDGPGLAIEDLDHVFDRFWHRRPPNGQMGSGLGLAMASATARACGGSVSVRNGETGGAVFEFELPVATAADLATSDDVQPRTFCADHPAPARLRGRHDAWMTASSSSSPPAPPGCTLWLTSQPGAAEKMKADAWIQLSYRERDRTTCRTCAAHAVARSSARRTPSRADVLGLPCRRGARLAVAPPAAAATSALALDVVSARTEPRAFGGIGVSSGDAVDSYTFLINLDTTGSTAQRTATGACSPSASTYPTACGWTSLNAAADAAPIVAQGTEADIAAGLELPDGKYLISVLADGYKLDGAHFEVPLSNTPVLVELQPMPLPDSTVKAQVFADMAPTNGAYDAGDRALQGFDGHLNDLLGEVTTDVYGNPVCTTYVGGPGQPRDPLSRTSTGTCSRSSTPWAAGA